MSNDQTENTGTPHTPPTRGATAFHCAAYASQFWYMDLRAHAETEILMKKNYPKSLPVLVPTDHVLEDFGIARCAHCRAMTLRKGDRLVDPRGALTAQPAPADLPEQCRADYDEARRIVQDSPRGAAALLRLTLQKLLEHLIGKKVRIDGGIAALVKQGLRPTIQKAMDTLRVTGNESVHPGVMDLSDDLPAALGLFQLVHIIVQDCIQAERMVDELCAALPETKREAIDKRDANRTNGE